MGEFIDFFKNKKNLTNLLFLGILVLALPLGINLVRQQQILKSRAVAAPIAFVGDNVKLQNGLWLALKPQITLSLTSDLGPAAGASASRTVQKDGGLVGTVYAGHDDGCGETNSCSTGTYCDGNDVFRDEADGTHPWVENCPNGCENGACKSSGGGSGGNYCLAAGYHACTAGAPAGSCTKDGKTCTKYETYQCNFEGQNYCDTSNCAEPCSGGTGGGGKGTRTCKATFTPSELGINDCVVCDRLHQYIAVNNCQKTCNTEADCPENGDQPNFIDPTTSNWCYEFKDDDGNPNNNNRCLQLRYIGHGDPTKDPDPDPPCRQGDTPRDPICDSGGGGGGGTGGGGGGGGGGTVGECTVSWQLSNENPAPGSTIQVKVRGVSDPKGWQNIELYLDGSTRDFGWGGIQDPWPTFVYNSVPAGSAGPPHTLKFTTDKNTRVCSPPKTFTSGTVTLPPPSSSPSPSPSPSPSLPPVVTVEFRVAETRNGLDAAPWQSYTKDGIEVPFEFGDKTPGPKQVWVEFKDSNGKTSRHSANIRLLGPGPTITSCNLIFEGSNVVFDIKGTNFGSEKGSAKSTDKGLEVKEWSDTSAKVVLANPLVGQTFPITLTNMDGQTGEGQCSAISTISLGAKVFCRAPSQHDTENVDLILVGLFEGGQKIRETVRIDKNGLIQNLTQRLEEGRKYSLSLQAPLSLRRTVEITAGRGVTVVPNFILPVGDIFPIDGGDGVINTFDKGELDRQWIIGQPATGRTGDFNRDTRVNSVDWACMRYDFGDRDDLEPAPGVPSASPAPPPRPSPSPSASPSNCLERPDCLDEEPRCLMPEPPSWCPGQVCAQVVTPARNKRTGVCREFPNACIPSNWQKVTSCSTQCPSPPACSGQLVIGDPAPNDPNQCPRYVCVSPSP